MSAERFTNIIGDWEKYKKFYTDSISLNSTENVCGKGSFGKVLKSTVDRESAIIKLTSIDTLCVMSVEENIAVSIREAQNLATISHLGISPKFYGFAIDKKNLVCVLIMEYLEGETLDKLNAKFTRKLRELLGTLPKRHNFTSNALVPPELAPAYIDIKFILDLHDKIMRKLSQTIRLLHIEGYVHYDIKPENIFVAYNLTQGSLSEGNFRIILIDLGSTRSIEEEFSENIGETPEYSLRYHMENRIPLTNSNKALRNNFYTKHRKNLRKKNNSGWIISPYANDYSLKVLTEKFINSLMGGKRKKRHLTRRKV